MAATLGPTDAWLIVDVQEDFCPGGALPVTDFSGVLEALNEQTAAAAEAGAIVASRDWHPPEHMSFQAQGGRWPAHCVRDSAGAAFRAGLELPERTIIISKGCEQNFDQYSAFEKTGLEAMLREQGIERVWVGGVATDVCVRATLLDALAAGFDCHLVMAASAPVEEESGRKTIEELCAAGVSLE